MKKVDGVLTIVFLSSPTISQSGDFVYRVRQPGQALAQLDKVRVIACPSISKYRRRLVQQADILIIDMLGEMDLVPEVAGRNGPVVYELSDNIFDLQPSNPSRYFFSNPQVQSVILHLIAKSQAVQTTSHYLNRLFSNLHQTMQTFPNQIARLTELSKKPEALTIGWGGSYGHLDDIRAIAPSLCRWFKQNPSARLHLMCAQGISDLFNEMPEKQKQLFPTGTLYEYESFLDSLTIGLAPIENTGFNLCRSDVKLLEYQAHGAVAICRRLGPYLESAEHAHNALLYEDTDELLAHLDRARDNPSLLQDLRQAGWEYIKKQRREEIHAPSRLQFYLSLLGSDRAVGHFDPTWLDQSNFESQGNYYELSLSEADKQVHTGLAMLSKPDTRALAAAHFEHALQLEPDHYLPYCYLAAALDEKKNSSRIGKLLGQAQQRYPQSHQIQLQQFLWLLSQNKSQKALERSKRALLTQPDNTRLQLHVAELAREMGDQQTFLHCLQTTLQENPHNFIASLELGLWAFRQGKSQQAIDYLSHHLSIRPENHQARFILACNLIKSGRITQSIAQLEQVVTQNPSHQDAKKLLSGIRRASR